MDLTIKKEENTTVYKLNLNSQIILTSYTFCDNVGQRGQNKFNKNLRGHIIIFL